MSLTVELIRVVWAVGDPVTLLVSRNDVSVTADKLRPGFLLSLTITASLITEIRTLRHSVTP